MNGDELLNDLKRLMRAFKLARGCPATAKERAAILKSLRRRPGVDPNLVDYIEFKQKLMARQGTVTPDFDALYRYKAELDRRLDNRNE